MPAHLHGLMRVGRLNVTFRDVSDGKLDATEFPRYRVYYVRPCRSSPPPHGHHLLFIVRALTYLYLQENDEETSTADFSAADGEILMLHESAHPGVPTVSR